MFLLILAAAVFTFIYCCYTKKKDHVHEVLQQVPDVVHDKDISDERVKGYFNLIEKALHLKRVEADGELDDETRQQLLGFLTEIIEKNKTIGPEIKKIVDEVTGKNLANGSIGRGKAEQEETKI